jgi:hypothetical protein
MDIRVLSYLITMHRQNRSVKEHLKRCNEYPDDCLVCSMLMHSVKPNPRLVLPRPWQAL